MQQTTASTVSHQDLSLWLDFYSQLLTPRTRDMLELHYNEDMSLSEIAELLGISRQGVHDRILKGVSQLTDYENSLGLARRFLSQKQQVAQVIAYLDSNQVELARDTLVALHDTL